MTIQDAERWLRQELQIMYDYGEAAAVMDWTMENLTGASRSQRSVMNETLLTAEQQQRLTVTHQRLMQQEPVQYVLGEAHFFGLKLFVNNAVLIPRPETEELVEWIIADVKASGADVFERRPAEADETKKLKLLDVGTGSGCIALALKKSMPKAEVWGCDISEEALNIARRNGAELDIRVDFQGLNFLEPSQRKGLPTVDILVSNPPYIPNRDKDTMPINVSNYEPHTALFVSGNNPLLFYEALVQHGKDRLYNGGSIYCEIHEESAHALTDLFRREGYKVVELKKDRMGKDRMVKVSSPPS